MKPVLQLALDSMNLEDAIKVAEVANENVDWIEVTNQLLKIEGLMAVRKVKERFPEKKVLVDMKIVDSRHEIEAAAKSGADIAVLTDNGNDEVLAELVDTGRVNGIEIMTELRDVSSLEHRLKFLEESGVDYLFVNVPNPSDEMQKIRAISESIRIPIALSAGIESETAIEAMNSGAGVIVVGRGITNGDDLKRTTKEIRSFMESKYPEERIPIAEDYLDLNRIAEDLDRVKDILKKLEKQKASEEKRRKEIERELEEIRKKNEEEKRHMERERKKLDDEVRGLDEQRERIKEEWSKLKEVELRWEEEQKRKESEYMEMQEKIWGEWEEEQRKRWKEWMIKREKERKDTDEGMKKIAEGWEEIENLSNKLSEEREKIKQEWDTIEKEMEKIENSRKEIKGMEANIAKERESAHRLLEEKGNAMIAFPKLTSRISGIYKEKERELRAIEKERDEIKKERSKIEEEWGKIQKEREQIDGDIRLMKKKEMSMGKDISKGWDEIERIKMGFRKGEISERRKEESSKILRGLSKIEKDLLRLKEEHGKRKSG